MAQGQGEVKEVKEVKGVKDECLADCFCSVNSLLATGEITLLDGIVFNFSASRASGNFLNSFNFCGPRPHFSLLPRLKITK